MDDKPRYAIRPGAVQLTRRQWVVLGTLLVAGIVLAAFVSLSAGGIAGGLTTIAAALTIAVNGRWP